MQYDQKKFWTFASTAAVAQFADVTSHHGPFESLSGFAQPKTIRSPVEKGLRHTDLQLHGGADAGGEGGGDASAAAAKQSSSVVSFIGGGSGEWARLQASSRNNKGVNEGVNEGRT